MFLIILCWCHFLADYGLQTEYVTLNKGKNIWAMISHCSIHALVVCCATILFGLLFVVCPLGFIVNFGITLGIFEFVAHYCIDNLKCKNLINYNVDQTLHLTCKVSWYILILIIL